MQATADQAPEFIYHLVQDSEFLLQIKDGQYCPRRFEQEGFIHATAGEELTLKVAEDYFAGTSGVLLLRIRLSRVAAKVTFEAPAPIPGGGRAPLQNSALFPHIYGALNLDAIDRIACLNISPGLEFPQFS